MDTRSSASKQAKTKKKKDTTSSAPGSESPAQSHISQEEYALFLKFKESQAKAKTATQLQAEKDAGQSSLHIHSSCCTIPCTGTDIRRRNEEMLRADSEDVFTSGVDGSSSGVSNLDDEELAYAQMFTSSSAGVESSGSAPMEGMSYISASPL